MLSLPEQLADKFQELCSTKPKNVARALSDLDGNPGATWVATEGDQLVFFVRELRSGDFTSLPYRFTDASALDVDCDGKFAFLNITFADRTVSLKFSAMDQMTLAKFQENWRPVTDQTDVSAPQEMTPMLIFCAAIQAMVKADHNLASQELAWIQDRMIDTKALRRGGAWLRDNGIDKLQALAAEELNNAQARCLYANLIALAMSDGAYRSSEAELVQSFRERLEITEAQHDKIFDVLMSRNNISVFKPEGEEFVSPEALNLFAACLLAMAEHDGTVHEKEEQMVRQLINENETINSARTYLEQLGVDGIIDYLPGPLTPEQKRCTVLNLMVVAMADGVLKSTKQALLDRVRRAMLIEDDVFDADFNTYLTMSNLSVFATEEEALLAERRRKAEAEAAAAEEAKRAKETGDDAGKEAGEKAAED